MFYGKMRHGLITHNTGDTPECWTHQPGYQHTTAVGKVQFDLGFLAHLEKEIQCKDPAAL